MGEKDDNTTSTSLQYIRHYFVADDNNFSCVTDITEKNNEYLISPRDSKPIRCVVRISLKLLKDFCNSGKKN